MIYEYGYLLLSTKEPLNIFLSSNMTCFIEVTDNCGWTPLGDCMERGILAYVKV